MKRRNGNRYDRKRHYQVRNNVIDNLYIENDWEDWSKARQQARQQLHHMSLDDDWDINTISPKNYRWGSSAPSVVRRRWHGETNKRLENVTAEDIRHLPQWAQHRWHQNLSKENDYYYCNWQNKYIYIRYDFNKVLKALEAAVRSADKLWELENPILLVPTPFRPTDSVWIYKKISIPLTDLHDWLYIQWADNWRLNSPIIYDEDGNYLYTINHKYITGLNKHICQTLLKLGYDVYKE